MSELVIDVGFEAEFWIRHALSCIPDDVLDEVLDQLAFVCMDTSDGKRLSREFCTNHEVIVLSERVVPSRELAEDSDKVRYFWFIVLHEVAHAYCNHRSPSSISTADNLVQEQEADVLAFDWYNQHLDSRKQPRFTEFELDQAKSRSKTDSKTTFDNMT